MTKLDGTAKGGILIAIAKKYKFVYGLFKLWIKCDYKN